MADIKQAQGGPLDIPDAESPTPVRTGAQAGMSRAERRARTASYAATPSSPRRARTASGADGASRGAHASKSASAGRRAGESRSVQRPRKRQATRADGELPLRLQKVADGFMALPEKLKPLPGRFVKLFDSWFYRIYFGAIVVALIAIFIGVRWLDGYAADYEASQPVHVADEVARLFTTGDYESLYDLDTAAQSLSGGDRDFYVKSLSALAADKAVDYLSAFSSDKDVLRYNVTLDGARFATFTLVPSGQVTAHGNTLWRLGTVTTNVVLENSPEAPKDPNLAPYHIQALPEYTVTVDGRALTQDDIIRTGIAILPDGFLPSGVTAPTLVEYGFYAEGETPQLSVVAQDGTALTPRLESENIWRCGPREDEALKAQYSDAIVKMAQRIAKYTTQDVSRNAALEAVQAGSPAEDIIKKFSNRWAPTHKEESFENLELSEFYVLTDTCLTCHVKFDYILTSRRQNDYTYPTEYTFCIVRNGGEGKLYNLVFH